MKLLKWLLGFTQGKGKKGTVAYNATKMRKRYPLNEHGYFGEKGKCACDLFAKPYKGIETILFKG